MGSIEDAALIAHALAAERVVLSVIGPHAGEDEATIFRRKIDDIRNIGFTGWLCRSPAASPDHLRSFFAAEPMPHVILFVAPASPNGARPTTQADRATEFRMDTCDDWTPLARRLGPITGNLKAGAYAFTLHQLVLCDRVIDLQSYGSQSFGAANDAIRFRIGASTLPALRKWNPPHDSPPQPRRVVAVGRFATPPHAVWVR